MNGLFGQNLIRKKDLWSFPRLIRDILLAIVILAVITYIVFSLKKIFAPPQLNIISPPNNIATSERQILLVGQVEPGARLNINGETILSNQSGNFRQTIYLHKGINYLDIKATKKYGGYTEDIRQIMVID